METGGSRDGRGVGNLEGVARAEEDTGTQRSQKMGKGATGIGMLGRRQVKPRWENDPVWLHDRSRQESGQGQVRSPHPPDGNQAKGGEGRIRAERVKKNGVVT